MSRQGGEPDTASGQELVPADYGLQEVLDVAARPAEVLVRGVLGAAGLTEPVREGGLQGLVAVSPADVSVEGGTQYVFRGLDDQVAVAGRLARAARARRPAGGRAGRGTSRARPGRAGG